MFQPRWIDQTERFELSVFRVDGLDREGRIALASGIRSDRDLVAWAEFEGAAAIELGLTIENDELPERHSNIVSWPDNKEDRMDLVEDLRDAAETYDV